MMKIMAMMMISQPNQLLIPVSATSKSDEWTSFLQRQNYVYPDGWSYTEKSIRYVGYNTTLPTSAPV